ncbi:acetylxylan esterase [Puniceicoccus vermicola]|uniref:Acetylxylan esterase n=1 Tax=Puniceicoccus vermicola TaxID=388746 RepID=A0A7X1E640_9BACT|nr:acetylxylan esterase [Puniceicoccus vermicola]MBC2603723.1 acetylxylan esterase [Puniceicoccus vermicola]
MNLKPYLFLGAALAIPFASAQAAKSDYSISVDHSDGLYDMGETATFAIENKNPDSSKTAEYRLTKNLWKTLDTVSLDTAAANQEVTYTSRESGWFRCSVLLPGERRPAAMSGIVFGADSFEPTRETPADFDKFWNQQKARLAASPAEAIVSPVTSEQFAIETQNPDHLAKVQRLEAMGYSYFNVEIPTPGTEPMRGYFAMPSDSSAGENPAILVFHAAGVKGGWCRSSLVNTLAMAEKYKALVLDINAHGMLNGQPQSYYDELEDGELKNYRYQGNDDRDNNYFLGMNLRLLRGIDFLCSRPEWDGKNLITYGVSQGGGQALAAAGLDSRVSATIAIVPALSNIAGEIPGWPGLNKAKTGTPEGDVVEKTMSYFDTVNFASRIQGDTLITVGLSDTTCPAPSVFAVYNQIKAPKEIISVPDGTHHGLSVPSSDLRKIYHNFILKHTKNE